MTLPLPIHPWKFEQIRGADRKVITLEGYAAPFGRPRKDPIMTEEFGSRTKVTRYPGYSGAPTRHSFGTGWEEEVKFNGRWMDHQLPGDLTANVMVEQWKAFIADERPVRISWGSVVSFTGYVNKLIVARESEQQVAWTLHCSIDTQDDMPVARRAKTPVSAVDITNNKYWKKWMVGKNGYPLPKENDLSPDFFDALKNLASSLNQPVADLNKLIGQIGNFQKATIGTIQAYRNAIRGIQVGLVTMREIVLTHAIDVLTIGASVKAEIEWCKYQIEFDRNSAQMLALLAVLDREAEAAGTSETGKLVVAQEGDTWETLSRKAYGNVDRAADLRKNAGARFGEKPVPGEAYLAP